MQLIHAHAPWPECALLDAGDQRKLERFGEVTVIRPEPKAWWRPRLDRDAWRQAADATFDESRGWQTHRRTPASWTVAYHGLDLQLRLADTSKHLGVFPEQAPHWEWLRAHAAGVAAKMPSGEKPRLLNLFGYTGVASLVAAQAGFAVTHVDASKPAIAWARDNQRLSGLDKAPIRWLLDDAGKFVKKEQRRGRQYEAILLDPPSFGRGPRGEVWKVAKQIAGFLHDCRKLLSPQAGLFVLTMYNLEASPLMLGNLMGDLLGDRGGHLELGELVLPHESEPRRLLPLSLFCRWAKV